MTLERGRSYRFSIVSRESEKTKIKAESGKVFWVDTVFQPTVSHVDLLISNIRKTGNKKWFEFTQKESKNKKFKWGQTDTVELIGIEENQLFFNIKDEDHFAFTSKNHDYSIGDKVCVKVNNILPTYIRFSVLGRNYDQLFTKDKLYTFPILEVSKRLNGGNPHSLIKCITPTGIISTFGNLWLFELRNELVEIKLVYKGERQWFIDYDNLICPNYLIGERYTITINEEIQNSIYSGSTKELVSVRVIKPFNSQSQNILGKSFEYTFQGLDNSGFLDFKQVIKFSDIIKSQALKVIAFNNFRKDYQQNEIVYRNLFDDYDNKNNLWVLSYGNTLHDIINEKIKSKDWDNAYLLLEVLNNLETWIINSGYLFSFNLQKAEEIKDTAENIIRSTKERSKAISIIIDQNFSTFFKTLKQNLKKKKNEDRKIEESIYLITNVLDLCDSSLPKGTFNLLKFIEQNQNEIFNNELRNFFLSKLRGVERNISYKMYKEVFINPTNRKQHFEKNENIRDCIRLLVVCLQLTKSNRAPYLLKVLRHLVYYTADLDIKKKLLNYTIDFAISKKNLIPEFLLDFNINDDDVVILIENFTNSKNKILKDETLLNYPTQIKSKVSYNNQFGYVFFHNSQSIFVPFKDSNIELKTSEEISLDVLAFHSEFNFGLGNVNNIPFNFIEETKSISIDDLFPGKVLSGIIKNIVPYGMFISFGTFDGLLPNQNVSYNSTQLKKIFSVGDEILVRVKTIENERIELERLSLLNEQAEENKYDKGVIAKGTLYRIDENHGLYLELENGASGYISKYDLFYNNRPQKLFECFSIGESIYAKVVQYDSNKGYQLSLKAVSKKNPIGNEIKRSGTFKVKAIFVNTIKEQLRNRMSGHIKDLENTDPFCPKCQKENYKKRSTERSFLKIQGDKKKWQCQWCDYSSEEQLIIRFLDFPVTGFIKTSIFNMEATNLIGSEFEVEVIDIYREKFIELKPLNLQNIFLAPEKDMKISKFACVELGYLFEEYISIENPMKNSSYTLCKYLFGVANLSRSYFHSFLQEYVDFINSLSHYEINQVNALALKANSMLQYYSSEELALETFPVLNIIIDSLKIISWLPKSYQDIFQLSEEAKFDSDNIEFHNTVRLAISFATVPNNLLKVETWEELKKNLRKNLKIIKEENQDDIKLRKEIKKIISENIESEKIECKGTFAIPIPTKSELKQIRLIRKELESIEIEPSVRREKELRLKELLNPKITKSKKEIVTLSWAKTIVAFANTGGGVLLIGIGEKENGDLTLLGLEKDLQFYKTTDDLLLAFDNQFQELIGNEFQQLIKTRILSIDGKRSVFHIEVAKSPSPVFLKKGKDDEYFYIRRNVSTVKLSLREFSAYSEIRFKTANSLKIF